MYEYDTDFPECGHQVDLVNPWRGYSRGTIVGRSGCRFVVELSSGAQIHVYDDEVTF